MGICSQCCLTGSKPTKNWVARKPRTPAFVNWNRPRNLFLSLVSRARKKPENKAPSPLKAKVAATAPNRSFRGEKVDKRRRWPLFQRLSQALRGGILLFLLAPTCDTSNCGTYTSTTSSMNTTSMKPSHIRLRRRLKLAQIHQNAPAKSKLHSTGRRHQKFLWSRAAR